jgi:hypothetical protein
MSKLTEIEKLICEKAHRYAEHYSWAKYTLGSTGGLAAVKVAFMTGATAMLHEILLDQECLREAMSTKGGEDE